MGVTVFTLATCVIAGALTGSPQLGALCGFILGGVAVTLLMMKGDTKPTVQQIRVHNQVGRNLGCW